MAVAVALNSCHRFFLPPTATTTTTFSSFAPKTRNPYPQLLLRSPFRSRFMAAGAPVKVKERIEVTETERRIFDWLLEVVRHFSLHTQLRVAGGWVRDKLLGRECYDIDVALDNMLGKDFCDKLEEYLKCVGEEPRGRADIKSNPDQSKHLETARMRIFNTWIDFVNLRSETYVENSRIPTMKFGTAEEDAYRRDLTINSLFYNINTDSVEDLTGRGLSDLKFGLIVTPLPPKATFLDDPLRVLRAIRFGARFEFVLDEELKKAAADEEVKAALADKISKERIGHEIDLMISGNQPVKAMSYILELQLFWTVFALPSDSEPTIAVDCDRLCTAFMNTALSVLKILESSVIDGGQQRLYLYAALFIPLRKSVYTDRKRKKVPVTNYIFQNSLKLKNSDAEMVVSLHRASEKFVSLIPFLTQNEDLKIAGTYMEEEFLTLPLHSKRRISAGLLLQEIKGYWRAALLLSTLLSDSVSHVEEHPSGASAVDVKIDLFRRIEKVIIQLELEDVWEMKPLLDGNVIMSTLQIKSGGPIVNQWKQRALKWQLAYPSGTADECLDWIKGSNAKRAKVA